ncbi:MAG: DegT/DnrJ/EryC1/StrS family aminotransferase [Flavobacteriales bacterium]|nr:DegT/DnrJ/EryC1/StrS family aminotransferase [Flavobacteriales bacterium]
MENIPFSPPRVDQLTVDAVTEVLLSGWITTGPKTRQLEAEIKDYLQVKEVLCLNSWTNACELMLRKFGVGEGDEVIIPSYTYAATANIVIHLGATPVMLDIDPRTFHITAESISKALTPKTKVVMPVDIGGLPVAYDEIMAVLKAAPFSANSVLQEQLGRPLFMSDAAHSFGASFNGARVGLQADVTGYSFHAVKNLTTAEGGALSFNLGNGIDNEALRKSINISALHGQTKDALEKTQGSSWRYDVIEAGFKCNMTDLQAAIGLVEFARYDETLTRRKAICQRYLDGISDCDWFIAPHFLDAKRESSYHLFMLRIDGASEDQRDQVMSLIQAAGVSVNVHFQPLPLLSFYKGLGYRIEDYPNSFKAYSSEISLPVYYDLSDEKVDRVIATVKSAVAKVL